MTTAIRITGQGVAFNYGAFAKYMVRSGNVIWRNGPGVYCKRPMFRRAVEVELGLDTETAKQVVARLIGLDMISVDGDNDVSINKRLR